jgi:hypothetical protein
MNKMVEDEVVCPNCHHLIEMNKFRVIQRAVPRFKWWVAPANLIMISLFLYILDDRIRSLYNTEIPWSLWGIAGLWLLYFSGIALSYRPEESWMIVPIFFSLLSLLLASVDVYTNIRTITFASRLTWSFYPIVTLVTFFVILPIISFIGKKSKHPESILREIISVEEEQLKEGKEI